MSDPSHLISAPPAAAATAQDGCPTPLAWQQVVAALREECVRHDFEYGGAHVSTVSLGTGPPVYFLPGFLGDHELYALGSWLLRDEFRCVLIDLVPQPSDRKMSAPVLLERWADAVLHLADVSGHEQLRLYGSGFGGFLALKLMAAQPQRLRGAALHCAFARVSFTVIERCVIGLSLRSRRRFGEVPPAMRIQQQNHRRWFPPFDPTRWDFYAGNVAARPVAEAALRARVAGGVDLRPSLSAARVPTLLLQTEGDGSTALAAQESLLNGLPDVRVETLDNTGRLPHLTHPHRLVKSLRAFWESTG